MHAYMLKTIDPHLKVSNMDGIVLRDMLAVRIEYFNIASELDLYDLKARRSQMKSP